MQGADNPALEAKIKEHYEAVGWDGETQSGVKVCSMFIFFLVEVMEYEIDDVAEEIQNTEQLLLLQGMIELNTFVSAQGTECLNEDDEHPYSGCLHAGETIIKYSIEFRQNGTEVHLKVLSSSSPTVMSN